MFLYANSLGAAYMGVLVSAMYVIPSFLHVPSPAWLMRSFFHWNGSLYGVTSVQTYFYFHNCWNDRSYLLYMVVTLRSGSYFFSLMYLHLRHRSGACGEYNPVVMAR